MDYAYIPSPSQSVWEIPLPFSLFGSDSIPLRAYALCIIGGIVAACWITEVRLRRRGAPEWTVLDMAVWAVPSGIIGGRLYHVITSPDNYFGSAPDADPLRAFAIWEGGLGIPGAVVLGGVGVWWACRSNGVPFSMVADALAPGLPVAQAVGRLGNWFNQELYGQPTTLPWGLEIDPIHQRDIPSDYAGAAAYEPTFLYEAVWNLGAAGLIWWLDRRFRFGAGRAFAVYVLCYGLGRFWIEGRRIDIAHAFLGLRVNEWVALAMVVGAVVYLLRVSGKQLRLVPDAGGNLHPVAWDSTQTEIESVELDHAKREDAAESSDDQAEPGGDPDAEVPDPAEDSEPSTRDDASSDSSKS